MPSIFLSHSHSDKPIAKRIYDNLRERGVYVWFDEAEIKVGDSLIDKIRLGIDSVDYLAVVLSNASVNSEWVKREVDIAMNQEIEGKRVKVLPLLVEHCDLPWFLKGKLYADFTDGNYESGMSKLLERLKPEFSQERKKITPVAVERISESSTNWFQTKKIIAESIQLPQSFGIIEHINYMANHNECHSALIFGPPGCGKSEVGRFLCNILSQNEKVNWNYIELTPANFLFKGVANIMSQTDEIFKRLARIRRAVVFFKDINEFQESTGEGGSRFVSDFVTRITELIKFKQIKLVLSSQFSSSQQSGLKPTLSNLLGIEASLIRLGQYHWCYRWVG